MRFEEVLTVFLRIKRGRILFEDFTEFRRRSESIHAVEGCSTPYPVDTIYGSYDSSQAWI
ncbi:MAG: hypothetical protein RMJ00_06155 [Nitrososphaerota archaeon]|nr:hypothetical protein [Candidatus Bathyarchaeota archaeon]MDW8062262.1 hypothetical protein [Nitrososphaerota archaeon]